jgi:CheY-like chemotaxis protein
MPIMDGPAAACSLAAMGALQEVRRPVASRSPAVAGAACIGGTGNALREDQHAFLAAGCHDVVIKPVSLQLLVAAVEAFRPLAAIPTAGGRILANGGVGGSSSSVAAAATGSSPHHQHVAPPTE